MSTRRIARVRVHARPRNRIDDRGDANDTHDVGSSPRPIDGQESIGIDDGAML